MDLFRKNQKLVFYILTPIIILAFVVWGVGDFIGGRGGQQDYEVARVDGKILRYREFEAFRKRTQASLGRNIALQFNGIPYFGTQHEEVWKYTFAYALLQDAEKAGARASDLQVGTYLEETFGGDNKGDREALDRAVTLHCTQHQISRQEFLRGVRDFQTMGNYVMDDANLAVVNDQTAYILYALGRGECKIKRIRTLVTDDIREQAKKDVMEKPADELEREVRDYAARKESDRRYREPSGWRFAYVLVPYAAESSVREAGKTEIQDYYDSNKTRFGDKPLAEVEDEIKAALRQAEVERQTMRNFTVDVDSQLRGQGTELDLAELVKLTPLVKYGVTAGDTGPDLLSPAEVMKKLPEAADFNLRIMLENLDTAPTDERDEFFKEWKDGFLLAGRPFKSDAGYFRLRLLDYRPSTPMPLNDEEGKLRPEILEIAVADMIADRVDALVDEKAAEMEQKIRDYYEAKEKGLEPVDAEMAAEFEKIPDETIAFSRLIEVNDFTYIGMAIGDILGPIEYKDPESGAEGRELVVLVDKRIHGRAAFDAERPEVKRFARQTATMPLRGGLSFTYTARGPTAVIQPSPTVMGALLSRYYRGQITVNPELMVQRSNDG